MITGRRHRSIVTPLLAIVSSLVALAGAPVSAQQQPLTQLQFDIVGARLVVDPPTLTVPKNIATQINTSLALPPGSGAETRAAIDTLTDGAVVEAELRGPDLAPTRIVTRAGQPIPLPPLAVPGDYFLDGIRLVKNGRTILDATAPDGRPATTIPIRVISEVFVTNVTSRPLSLDDIRGKGIVIDQTNFRAVTFQVAFNIDGAPFTINLPAALPTPEFLKQRPTRAAVIEQLTAINTKLRALETQLPPQFDRPGLNFSIAALPFFPVDDDGDVPLLDVPPITGLVVIPGNIAFLNQFFSVLLMVTNVAPDGTTLELRETAATVVLPKGLDRVNGSYDQPGDDPLRLARIEGAGIQSAVPVVQLGPDGLRNTADDITSITPQKSGEGEFLVEGLKEGAHFFDLEIQATLYGLPSGPVKLMGLAAGAVFVRNPTFSVTVAHPRTIRAGERYDLYATVTNTAQNAANLVSVNLDPHGISGAQLVSDASVSFETIAPGQAATARFTLIAQRTGEVTFSSFTGEAASGGGIQLTTGVDERGVPLAPNAIVLPKSTNNLPADLVTAAQRVLGQAFSIATAPAEALPAGVLFVKKQAVIDRGLDLAQAGERLGFGEPLARVVQDLALDWLGNTSLDAGFDQILRTTEAGAALLSALAAVLQTDAIGPGILAYQAGFAQTTVGRSPHVSAAVGTTPGVPAPLLTVSRALGGTVGRTTSGAERSLVSAAVFDLTNAAGDSRLAIVGTFVPDRYTVEIVATTNGVYDLGAVVPGATPGQLVQLRYSGIALAGGGRARIDVQLPLSTPPSLTIDRAGDGHFEGLAPAQQQIIMEAPPTVVAVRQLVSAYRETAGDVQDPATYGLLVGVLFDKPVTPGSAELKSNYAIDANSVIGARLQSSGRLVYLYLERPVGALVPRSLGVSSIFDARGNIISPSSTPIVMALTDGGRVFGQVRTSDGRGVPASTLKLTVSQPPFAFDVSTIRTDANGSFDFDFVPRIGNVVLTAQHPATLEIAALTARLRGQGEQLLVNPTFQGKGFVRGRVLAADGLTPVANAQVALLPGAVTSRYGFETRSNALGEFSFADAPVGVFTLNAADTSGGIGQTTGVLSGGGQTETVDIVLTSRAEDGGRVVGRVFLSDGATPGAGFVVFVGSYERDTGRLEAVDRTTTDAAGSFTFDRTLPPSAYDVVAFDAGTQQLGVVRTTVQSRLTTSVSIVLEATGMVEGVVFNAAGVPQAGALVAGGVSLVQTDANGFFRLEGVPAGRRRIEAGDPVTRRRGSAEIVVLPGQTVSASMRLEARATITGRVLDAAGVPVPRATVRIPSLGGFTFVFANDSGVFRFPDLGLGDYLIQAPGPSRESLISFMQANGYDPRSAFTSGDIPSELDTGDTPSYGDKNAVLAAYQDAVRTFLNVDESLLVGLPMADRGGFGWNRVRLFQDSTTAVADVKFLSMGTVAGRTVDADGRPIGALTRITGLSVSRSGAPTIAELGRLKTDAATGAFTFAGIPRFDLATFQAAGVRGGDVSIEAAHPFSPVIAQFRGQLTTTTPNLLDIVVQFPSATETNGTIRGRVLMPDGSPAAAGTQVAISFGDLTLTTDAGGRFDSALPIPAGAYSVTAQAPSGLRGRSRAIIPAGGSVDIDVQLLGLGSVTVVVRRPTGQAIAGAAVVLERGTFPNERFNGTTDGTGQIRFVNVTEGPFSVVAEEAVTALTGRASGSIVRDASIATPVTITAAGRVTGRFVAADGAATIAFAQVVLSTGGVNAFTTTDATGRFELTAIPVGRFSVDALDPNSGRLGRASGELLFDGQSVDVTILQLPRGTVTGLVVHADGTTTVPGASVRLASDSIVRTDLQANTRPDGSFRFEGIPAGQFTLTATEPLGGFTGTATGRLTFEGEAIARSIALEPFGSLRVSLLDVGGQPASNATIAISRGSTFSRTAAVDVNGQFTFDFLPIGTYLVVGRSLASAGNGGQATVDVVGGGQTSAVTVTFRGAGNVAVTVVAADGSTVVPSAQVKLRALASAAGDPPGALATELSGFTNASGIVTFQSVPVGAVVVTAEAAALGGVGNAVLSASGQTATATVRLGPSGSVAGRVLLPDGTTPAAQAIVTLRFPPQSSLQTGVVQVTTHLTGTFEFTGIPVGTFTIDALEIVSSGVRTAAGTVAANGQRVDVGDLVLDNTSPRVVSIDPVDGTTGVALQPAIAVTFGEPMRAASFRSSTGGNILLLDGTTPVALQSVTLSNASRTITIRATHALRSNAIYTLTIRGGQDGPRDDAADLPMVDAFVSRFTTADTVAPLVVSARPASGERQVSLDASVRFGFSEPILGGTLTLRESTGAVVTGTSALTAGNSALVFAPLAFLRANTTYTATLAGVTDTAGNALGASTLTFTTIDTIAPIVTALQISGVVRAGAQVVVTPTITGTDIQRVDYLVGGATTSTSATSPYSVSLSIPATTPTLTIVATAFDDVGNRSSAFTRQVPVVANAAPTVTLRTVLPVTQIGQGQSVEFEAVASDDDGVARVALSAVGAGTFSEVRQAPGATAQFTTRFTVQIPAGAVSGSTVTAQAVAIDGTDAQSAPALVTLAVVDGVRPSIAIQTPINNAVIIPGQLLSVVVDATDDVGVTAVSLVCTPTFAGCGTRLVQPAVTSTRQTFTVDIPATFQTTAGIVLLATASDQAGNTIQAGRTVVVPDTVRPTLTGLVPVSGSTQVAAGQTAALRATASDNVGVIALSYRTEGAFVSSGQFSVTPPVTNGPVTLAIPIPVSAATGSTVTVRVTARDAGGNVSDEQAIVLGIGDTTPPVVSILSPAAGVPVAPGQTITFAVRATDDTAVQRIVFNASGVVTATDTKLIAPPVASVDASFLVAVPAGTAAGSITLTAEAFDAGGASSGVVTRVVAVTDAIAPAVRILSPAAGAQIDPRSPVSIVVEATDAVGVTQIALATSDAVSSTETRAVTPTALSRTEAFTVTFTTPLVSGGTLNLNASGRDSAGNLGTASLALHVRDVVAPTVSTVAPANAATGVAPTAAVTVTFSEAMSPATLTAGAVRLAAGGTPVSATLAVSTDGRSVTLTPTAPLAINTIYTVSVDTTAGDPGGNALATAFTSTFRTSSPDSAAPRVTAVDPVDNATGVGTTVPVSVTFSEAVDPASVTAATFRVISAGSPIPGSIAFLDGNRVARFTPATPYPFDAVVVTELTAAITDTSGNALVAATGQPLTAPLSFTFLTGNFAITSPAGTTVVEKTPITLTAQAGATLNVTSVVFSVNGTALPAIATAPFSTQFNVPSTSTPVLTIVASARNAQNSEIARAEKVVTVVGGLTASPALLGVRRGATRVVRFSIAEAATSDLAIALSVADPSVFTIANGAAEVTILAGQTSVDVPIVACVACAWDPVPAGKAIGSTSLVATSTRGAAVAIVSVSDAIPAQALTTTSAVLGTAVSQAPTVGHFFTVAARTSAVSVRLLTLPLAGGTPRAVTVTSSNPAVATATATAIQPGEQTTTLTVEAFANGTAVLTIHAGNEVWTITIVVGSPTPGQTPMVVGVPVGVAVSAPPSAGQLVSSVGRTTSVTMQMLSSPHTGSAPLPVSVISSDPSIATAVATAVAPGSQVTTLTITTLTEGFVSFTLRAGTAVRAVGVYVGTPPPARTPVIFAAPVGVAVAAVPGTARVNIAAGSTVSASIGIQLLTSARSTATAVVITSSNPSVVSLGGNTTMTASIAAGGRTISVPLLTSGVSGVAVLRFEFEGGVQDLAVVVGTLSPSQMPVLTAPVIGIRINP